MPAPRTGPPALVALALLLAACAPVGSVITPDDHPASPTAVATRTVAVVALAPVPQPDLPAPLRPDGEPPGVGVGPMDHAAMGHAAMGHAAMGHAAMGHAPMGHEAAATDHGEGAGDAPMADALDAYLAVHDALASDRLGPAVAHGAHFAAAFAHLAESPPADDPHFWHTRADDTAAVRDATARLAEAGDLAAARQAFGALSAPFARLVEAAGVPEGYDLVRYTCGMAEGVPEGGVWLQRSGDTRNPYYGAAMPTCGTEDEAVIPERAAGAEGHNGDEHGEHGDHDTERTGHEGH